LRGNEPQTDFEKPRGVSRVEVRDGYAQAFVTAGARLDILRAVSQAGVSIDFLKLAPTSLSFLVPQDRAAALDEALGRIGAKYEIKSPRSVVMVHAVNMRDEEGLIARIVSSAIGTGLTIEHLGDMHDRMLIVLESSDAAKLTQHLRDSLAEARR
jgi:aspartokinase